MKKQKIRTSTFSSPKDYVLPQVYNSKNIGCKEKGRSRFPYFFKSLDDCLEGSYLEDRIKIKDFLIEAKKQTYANEDVEKASSTRKGSHDYHYQNNEMIYHDTYFGGTKFMGEEVVYHNDETPIWGMNYYGITLYESLSEEAMDKALRPALMLVGEDKNVIPVRGPRNYKNGEYEYNFSVNGNLDCFEGEETIHKGKIKVYELKCHGGIIKR